MKNRLKKKTARRALAKSRVRKRIKGTEERPRLAIFRSNLHTYAQIIDDAKGVTLVSASTVEKEGRDIKVAADQATFVGSKIAERAAEKGVSKVVFDRAGHPYHGNVKVLADKARETGLQF
jgi:large subunit ribosomal protein L18